MIDTLQKQTETYHRNRLSSLVGKKITEVLIDFGEGELYTPFVGLKFGDSATVWCMCDAEGNGPGHLQLLTDKGDMT